MFENIEHSVCPSCRNRITLESLIKLQKISPTQILCDCKLPSLKIVAIGDAGTGKSSLVCQYASGIFPADQQATVGCDLMFKNVGIAGKIIKLSLWDTAGQERFSSLSPAYLRNAHGVLLVYDITQPQTLEHVKDRWIQIARTSVAPHAAMILVGNRADLRDRREISTERGQEVANELGINFFKTSAKEAYNVQAAFSTVVAKALDNLHRAGLMETLELTDSITLYEHVSGGKNSLQCSC